MPRWFFLLILFFLFLPIFNSAQAQSLFLTGEDIQVGKEILLDDFRVIFPSGSLDKYSRVAFFTKPADNSLPSALPYFYNWQVLDANIVKDFFIYLPRPDQAGAVQVWQREAGKGEWRAADFIEEGSELKVKVRSKLGQLAVTVLPLSPFSLYLDEATIAKGFRVQMPGGYFVLHIPAAALTAPAEIKITPILPVYPKPQGWDYASPLFYFQVIGDNVQITKPLVIDIKFSPGNSRKEIFAWNNSQKKWEASPSDSLYKIGMVRTATRQKELLVAVLTNGIMEKGKASWYAYKGGLFAASPDYPKGTKLKVTNLANGKSVVVTVNDYGPDRSIHPDRVIDLDKVAFAKISSLYLGLTEVVVDPLYP